MVGQEGRRRGPQGGSRPCFRNQVIDRICCTVTARNTASVFNYKKLGFNHVGTLHQAQCDPVSGELFDTLIFELLRADWEKQGKRTPCLKLRNSRPVRSSPVPKCSLDAVGADASVERLPQWDSIGHVKIILEVETDLGRKLLPKR